MLTPYCHGKEPIKIGPYILGALMPGFLLGMIPAVISSLTGNIFLLIYGLIFIFSAGGDLTIIRMLRKERRDSLVQDHPSKVGCFVYEPK